MKPIKYQTLKLTSLGKDDILVFKTSHVMSESEYKRMEHRIKKKIGNIKFIILDDGMTIERLRKRKK